MTTERERQQIHHLLVIEDKQGKRTIPLEAATCSIGRDPNNSIVLDSIRVSRQHAILLRVTTPDTANYLFRLIDGNLQGKRSTNGLIVNGNRCFAHDLKHGDMIVFGGDVKARYYASSNLSKVERLTSCEVEELPGSFSNLSSPFETFVELDAESENTSERALIRLASFPELISNPILEINLAGTITYLNPAAVAQFPNIQQAKSQHPILAGLLATVQNDKKKFFVREVEFDHQVFEQSVHYIAESDLIRTYVVNITEHKQAEEDIRKALEKEKELGELKSRFVTMTSHEFRTPLATILSSAELLEHYSHKWSEEKKLVHVQRIQTAVQHMTGLLNDVLLIGKGESGKLEFKPAPLDLVQFCHGLVEELQLTTATHTIDFHTQGQCTNVYMDEKLLRHILSNLLSNAIKYSPKGGTIQFKLMCKNCEFLDSEFTVLSSELENSTQHSSTDDSRIIPQTQNPEKVAIFRIQDQGIGIPEADQAQLFNSFHRASNVGTISGTGLGLAIVKKSVDVHGGTIAVKSGVGMGTLFTVTLPLNKQV